MTTGSFTTSYRGKTAAQGTPVDLVLLEQRPWKPYAGIVTTLNFVRYLAGLLYPEGKEAEVDCGMGGDGMIIGLDVYPLKDGVVHRLAATAGQLSDGVYEEVEERESVFFDLEREAQLKNPARAILAQEWLTGPYAADGNKIGGPGLSVSGRSLRSSRAVLGTVLLTLLVPRHTYLLTVAKDEANALLAAGWSEYAVAMPAGGKPVGLSLQPPPGAEELAQSSRPCGRRSSVSGTWPDDDGEPAARKITVRRIYDYCSLEFEREVVY